MKQAAITLQVFRSVIESSPDPILITNTNAEIVFVNKAWQRLTGYTLKEVIGKNPRILHSDETSPNLYKQMFTATSVGKSFTTEAITDKRKDGSEYQIRSTFYPITLRGKKTYYVQSQHDITSRVATTKKTTAIASLVSASEDAMVATTLNGKITSWNPSAERMFGYTQGEAVGKSLAIIIPEYKQQEADDLLTQLNEGKAITNIQTVRLNKDGTPVPVSVSASPVKGRDGKLTGALRVYRDISKQQKIEALKSEFLSIVAHELKTPITAAKLYTDLALFKADKLASLETNTSELHSVNHQLNRLSNLINDMLDVTRIESGRLVLHLTDTDFDKLLRATCHDTQLLGQDHIVKYHRAPETLIAVDPARMEQVILNLLTNAMKYSPAGTQIDVWLKKRKDDIVVSVKDRGQGIPKDKVKYIFDRFYQVAESQQKGFGIGLYISKEIVTKHNGKIWVRSTPGKGSRFSFSLLLKNHSNK